MNGNVVDASGVNVDRFAKFGVNDARAFDMPAGVAGAVEIIPLHRMVLFWLDEFPEGEIGWVAFFGIEVDAGASLLVFEVEMGEVGIVFEFAGIVVDAVGSFVGETFFGEFVNEVGAGFDVVGCFSDFGGLDEIECAEIGQEILGVIFGDLPDGLPFPFGALEHLVFAVVSIGSEVSDVGDIEDAIGLKTIEAEGAQQEVPIDISCKIADVLVVVDGGSAGVDFDVILVLRRELVDSFGKCVIKSHFFSISWCDSVLERGDDVAAFGASDVVTGDGLGQVDVFVFGGEIFEIGAAD